MSPARASHIGAGRRLALGLGASVMVASELTFWFALIQDVSWVAAVARCVCACSAAACALGAGRGSGQRQLEVQVPAAALALALPGAGVLVLGLVQLTSMLAATRASAAATRSEPASAYDPDRLARILVSTGQGSPLASHAAADVPARMRAVMALSNVPDGQAIPLLRAALNDTAEEVRLLAHAMLERKERRLRLREQSARAALGAAAEPGDHARAALDFAGACLALADSGLLSERARLLQLEEAGAVLTRASDPTLGAELALLGTRVALAAGKLHDARAALASARSAGASATALAELAAELAFAAGDRQQLRELLSRAPQAVPAALASARPESSQQRKVPWSA